MAIVLLANIEGDGLRIRRDIGISAIGACASELKSLRVASVLLRDSAADLWAGVPLGETPGRFVSLLHLV